MGKWTVQVIKLVVHVLASTLLLGSVWIAPNTLKLSRINDSRIKN